MDPVPIENGSNQMEFPSTTTNGVLKVSNNECENLKPTEYLTYDLVAQTVFDNLLWDKGHIRKYSTFIELIKQRPLIWDLNRFVKRKDLAINVAWDEIIVALSPDPNNNFTLYSEFLKQKIRFLVKQRWYALKSQWTRCYLSSQNFQNNQLIHPSNNIDIIDGIATNNEKPNNNKKRNFHYFEQMLFLKKLFPNTSTPIKSNQNQNQNKNPFHSMLISDSGLEGFSQFQHQNFVPGTLKRLADSDCCCVPAEEAQKKSNKNCIPIYNEIKFKFENQTGNGNENRQLKPTFQIPVPVPTKPNFLLPLDYTKVNQFQGTGSGYPPLLPAVSSLSKLLQEARQRQQQQQQLHPDSTESGKY